jgi:kynurenine formamidase
MAAGPLIEENVMARSFVDLSIYLENDVITDPPFMRPKIEYMKHQETMPEMGYFFPGVSAEQVPGGEGFAAAELVTLSTHNGTHLDAPWHFHPTQDGHEIEGGKPSMTIDEVPLEWCFQPGVKLDFRHFADGYVVSADDVEAELARIGHTLRPLDIVLVNTAAGMAVGNPDFVNIGCGMGYDATMYLTSRGVRVTGTDAWSWDAPFSYTAKKVAETGDTSLIWEGHKAGRDIGYCHLEKLHNLEVLPPHGFTMCCFPHKIKGASAGWTRAVAIIEDGG